MKRFTNGLTIHVEAWMKQISAIGNHCLPTLHNEIRQDITYERLLRRADIELHEEQAEISTNIIVHTKDAQLPTLPSSSPCRFPSPPEVSQWSTQSPPKKLGLPTIGFCSVNAHTMKPISITHMVDDTLTRENTPRVDIQAEVKPLQRRIWAGTE